MKPRITLGGRPHRISYDWRGLLVWVGIVTALLLVAAR